MSRLLALDVGDERTGVAISDEAGLLARPLEMIARKPGPGGFHRIAELVRQYDVRAIVVGLPLLPDGSEGKQVASTKAFVRGLSQHVSVPILWHDESDTTRRAREILVDDARSGKRRAQLIDATAAAVLLQSYLDEQASQDR
ncbi:MAG: Holliday junction resolvase RuvX [Anaerolineales bacterium]